MNEFKSALWWTGAHMENIDDVMSIIATRDTLSLEFPSIMAVDSGFDSLAEAARANNWYLTKAENDGIVIVNRKKPEMTKDVKFHTQPSPSGETNIVTIVGFAVLHVDPNNNNFIELFELLPKQQRYTYESGIGFWYEFIPVVAKLLSIEAIEVEYAFVSRYSLDDVEYTGL